MALRAPAALPAWTAVAVLQGSEADEEQTENHVSNVKKVTEVSRVPLVQKVDAEAAVRMDG